MTNLSTWDAWISLFANRNEVAEEYAKLIRGDAWLSDASWRGLNEAIIRRWSPAGLKYIKTRAWRKIFEEAEWA